MAASDETPILLPVPFTYSTPRPTLLAQGAEALVYRTHFLLPSQPCVLKYRPSKPYRHPTLDKRLTRHRILSEARILVKCRREGVTVPAVLALDAEGNGDKAGGWMMIEWIEGNTVKEVLIAEARRMKAQEVQGWHEGSKSLMRKVGVAVGRMHEVGICHGDLTTSNMMLRPTQQKGLRSGEVMTNGDYETGSANGVYNVSKDLDGEIVLIDFGLAAQSDHEEDRAVDLYVLEKAFGSTHPEAEDSFQEVLKAYRDSYKAANVVLKRLEDVRMRGRKRSMIG